MNKQRRKEIYALISKLKMITTSEEDAIIIADQLADISEDVGFIKYEEEYYMDNIPENMQGGTKYEAAEEACDNLEDAMDSIRDAQHSVDNKDKMVNCIENAIDHLSEAAI